MTALESRVCASWRVQACAAGLCAGAQLYLFGTGIAMPVTLCSAWIASLAALPMVALTAALCRRALVSPRRPGHLFLALQLLLALTLLCNAAFALCGLVSLAGQTLLVQARALWSAAVAVVAIALCALTGGAPRLCFALRWALPALLALLTALCLPPDMPAGLFPLLGAGGAELATAAVCMQGAASPLLMLMLPPRELARAGEAGRRCPVPGTRFFVTRALCGAGAGALLLLAADACTAYEALLGSGDWGERLPLVANPGGGMLQTALTVCQLIAVALLAVCQLAAAEQALLRALPQAQKGRAGLWALVGLLAAGMAAFIVLGMTPALFAAPLLIVPTALLLIAHRRMGGMDG